MIYNKMGAYIKAISYYLPEQVVTNEDLVSEFPEWSVEKVASKVGVNVRHVAAVDETAGDMAEMAAKKTPLILRILISCCFVRKVLIIICRPQLVYYNID
jgi:hypothetical protein